MFKRLCVCTLALCLMACSEDMLTPKYNEQTPLTTPDEQALQKHPFLMVTGEWIDDSGGTTVNIDDVGNFVMRNHTTSSQETGYLVYINDNEGMRFALYQNNKKAMDLAFRVKTVDNKRELLLLGNGVATPFRSTSTR